MLVELNIPPEQQAALTTIDVRELAKFIEQAVRVERLDDLHGLPIAKCGTYITTQLHNFEEALTRHHLAKSQQKREETKYALDRAARDLVHAVQTMKSRMDTEQNERLLFIIDDLIMPPSRFSRNLSVRVSYQWRKAVTDEWTYSSITFVYDVDVCPDFSAPAPKRKPSKAKQEEALQGQLYRTWEHLMRGALYSVRDYFRDGGDGHKIPDEFQVRGDSYSGGLNNYSTQFWRS